MNYDFLTENSKNKFYPVTSDDIQNAENELDLKFPKELKKFLLNIGYGFIFDSDFNANCIMSPLSIKNFRMRLGEFEFYPDIEMYDEIENNKLIFFEGTTSVMLSIELGNSSHSRIFYNNTEIAESLEEFLKNLRKNNFYYLKYAE